MLNRWNSLTQELVDSESVNSFKSGLEKLRKRQMGFLLPFILNAKSCAAAQCKQGKQDPGG